METVKIKLLEKESVLPAKASEHAAGYDIVSIEETVIEPGTYMMVRTGLSIEMPVNTEAQVRPRSGLAAKHGITVLNAPGTIDADYRGEIKVILINHSKEPFHITRGMRIAQLIFSKVLEIEMTVANTLNNTERGEGGFGSTGTKTIT